MPAQGAGAVAELKPLDQATLVESVGARGVSSGRTAELPVADGAIRRRGAVGDTRLHAVGCSRRSDRRSDGSRGSRRARSRRQHSRRAWGGLGKLRRSGHTEQARATVTSTEATIGARGERARTRTPQRARSADAGRMQGAANPTGRRRSSRDHSVHHGGSAERRGRCAPWRDQRGRLRGTDQTGARARNSSGGSGGPSATRGGARGAGQGAPDESIPSAGGMRSIPSERGAAAEASAVTAAAAAWRTRAGMGVLRHEHTERLATRHWHRGGEQGQLAEEGVVRGREDVHQELSSVRTLAEPVLQHNHRP